MKQVAFLIPLLLLMAPGVRAADSAVIDACNYSSDAAAQAAWKPMSNSRPVTVTKFRGEAALKLTCQFANAKEERGSWDFATNLDLSSTRSLQFQVACPNPAPASYFSIYLQSGTGWYIATFFPDSTGWNTIQLDRTAFQVEGKPAGWNQIRTIRISAWRGKEVDTEFYFRDLRRQGVLGVDSHVLLISSPVKHSERNSSVEFSDNISKLLAESGVLAMMIDDEQVTDEKLKLAKLVILPHSPGLSGQTIKLLEAYLKRGGKLITFYGLDPTLQKATGITLGKYIRDNRLFASIHLAGDVLPGSPRVVRQNSYNIVDASPATSGNARVLATWHDASDKSNGHNAILASENAIHMTHVILGDDSHAKRDLLFAMAGTLVPSFWTDRLEAERKRFEHVGPYDDFATARREIGRAAVGNSFALQALAKAESRRQQGDQLAKSKKFAEALTELTGARTALLEAYCSVQKPQPNEFRGFWCHDAKGVDGMTWDEAIKTLSSHGFNAIFPNMLWGGGTSYESAVLPTMPSLKGQGDQIALCLDACRKHGVALHVWKVNWNMGHDFDEAFHAMLRQQQRVQVSRDGEQKPWLCPSHPKNQQLEIDSMVEVVQKYKVDGIHFDYIRFPDDNHCFCDGCRERFAKASGKTISSRVEFAKETSRGGALRDEWNEWRRAQITSVVQRTSETARKVNPNIKLSAAVFRNWPVDRHGVAQEWSLWCEKGYLDFVCPMDYTRSDVQLDDWVLNQKIWAHGKPVYPGIGAYLLSPEATIDQIAVTRKHNTRGFLIFNYGRREATEIVPLLGLGTTRKE